MGNGQQNLLQKNVQIIRLKKYILRKYVTTVKRFKFVQTTTIIHYLSYKSKILQVLF